MDQDEASALLVSDEQLTAFFRRFALLVQREAAHQVVLEALQTDDSEFQAGSVKFFDWPSGPVNVSVPYEIALGSRC